MEHLEAWHARHERMLLEALPLEELGPTSAADGGQAETNPEWLRLKEDSKKARTDKSQARKEHNRTLRKLVQNRGCNKALRVKRDVDSGKTSTKRAPKGRNGQEKKSRKPGKKSVNGSFRMKLRSS